MRVTKVVLGLAGFLLMSLIFVSFQAAAHPEQSHPGLANGPWAPVGSHIADPESPGHEGFVNGISGENSNAGEAIGNNPLCPRHEPKPHTEP